MNHNAEQQSNKAHITEITQDHARSYRDHLLKKVTSHCSITGKIKRAKGGEQNLVGTKSQE